MQSRFIALMLVALLAATCVVAEEKVEPVGEGGDAPEEPELDAEGEAKAELTKIDTNKDSNLDLGEIKKHYEYTDEEDTTEGEEGGAEPDTPEDDAGDEASADEEAE